MGVLFDHFSAYSDEVAATAIDGSVGQARRPSIRRRRRHSTRFRTKGIEPVVMLGKLEALLISRDYEEIVSGSRAGRALAIENGGERVVLRLTTELQTTLADADDERAAAVPLSKIEEFRVANRSGLPPGSMSLLNWHAAPVTGANGYTAGSASSCRTAGEAG